MVVAALGRGGAWGGRRLGLGVDWGVMHPQGWPRPSSTSPTLPCTFMVREKAMVRGACTSWGACRQGSRVRLGAGCGAAPQGAPCLVVEESWEEVQGVCQASTCLAREVVSRRHPLCEASLRARQPPAGEARQWPVGQVGQASAGEARQPPLDLLVTKLRATKNITRGHQNLITRTAQPTAGEINSLNSTNNLNVTKSGPAQRTEKPEREAERDALFLDSCRGVYNPAAQTRLLNICRDCYNLFREVDVFSLCTAGCFTSPFFLTCAKALIVEVDSVREVVSTVG